MPKFPRKVLPNLLVLLALLLGGWTQPSFKAAPTQKQSAAPAGAVGDQLCGKLASLDGAKERVNATSSFSVDMDKISSSNVSDFDKDFIEDSIVTNTLELRTLQYSQSRVTNQELRCLINVMITQHTKDLKSAKDIADKIDLDVKVDLTKASVYPRTPDYDLGMRTENLQEHYLKPLRTDRAVPFNRLSINILHEEHVEDVQSELTAWAITENQEIKAFAKHGADVTELHILLMSELHDRLYMKYESEPEFQSSYMNPRESSKE